MRKYLFTLSLIGLMVCGMVIGSPAADPDASILFQKAGDLYREQKYTEAISIYESLIEKRAVSLSVYYNLGNAYYKDGQVGKAILNYERARRLNPRDGDLNANYRYVKSQIKTLPDTSGQNFLISFFNILTQNITADELAVLLIITYFLTGSAVLLIQLRRLLGGKAALSISVALFLVILSAFCFKTADQNKKAVIIEDSESKFEPSDTGTTHFNLSEGFEVKVLESDGLWRKVKRQDGKAGWVKQDVLEKVE